MAAAAAAVAAVAAAAALVRAKFGVWFGVNKG